MNTKRNIALCYLPDDQKVRTFKPEHLERFDNISSFWMKRKGLVFYPFDRNKPAYFYADDHSGEKALEFELSDNEVISKEEYEASVFIAQQNMGEGELQKVVLARNKILPRTSEPEKTFKNAIQTFPNSYCYYADLGVETWVGASPELLLEFKDGILRTMALAGTKALNESFTQKEEKEQAMVEEFIETKLKTLGLLFKKGKKEDLVQGNIKHLKTPYELKCSPDQALELLRHLQPTSAVCGLPRDQSFDFIQNFETINRSFYSGLVGILDADSALFFVNLRCLRFKEDKIELFAGAGITQDSKSNDEWSETEQKLELIESLLN